MGIFDREDKLLSAIVGKEKIQLLDEDINIEMMKEVAEVSKCSQKTKEGLGRLINYYGMPMQKARDIFDLEISMDLTDSFSKGDFNLNKEVYFTKKNEDRPKTFYVEDESLKSRVIKGTAKAALRGLVIATAANTAVFGGYMVKNYIENPLKYDLAKPSFLAAETFRSIASDFKDIADKLNPPQLVSKTVIPIDSKKEVVMKEVYINFDSLQQQRITELAAVFYNTETVYKYKKSNAEDGILPSIDNFFNEKELMMRIPVKAKAGYNLSNIVNQKGFAVAYPQQKKILIKVPRVEILSVETVFEKITEQDITAKEGVFSDISVLEVVQSFADNQIKFKEGLLNKEVIRAKAKDDSKKSLEGILSLLTFPKGEFKDYKLEFIDLSDTEARKMGWKPIDEDER